MLEEQVHPPSQYGPHKLQRNEYPSYSPAIPPISIRHDASQQSFDKTRRYQKSAEHQKTDGPVATDSSNPCDAQSRRVVKDNDGSDVEQEWIDQYQD
jgi:hypothetical protein